jgi:hypothetical protein
LILADSLTDADDAPPQLTAATSHVPTVRDSDVLGKLRSKMLSRIAARAGGVTPAAGAVIANAADAGSWENQEAEEMAKGMAAWRKVQARRRRLQTHRSDDESSSILSLFLLTSAVCSLAFFVFDFVSWDCT